MPALGWLLNLDFAGRGGVGISYASYGSPILFTSGNWSNVAFSFEAYFKATSGTAYGRLYNETDATAVTGSDISTVSATNERVRSGTIAQGSTADTLKNGKLYRSQFVLSAGGAGEAMSARLIAVPT